MILNDYQVHNKNSLPGMDMQGDLALSDPEHVFPYEVYISAIANENDIEELHKIGTNRIIHIKEGDALEVEDKKQAILTDTILAQDEVIKKLRKENAELEEKWLELKRQELSDPIRNLEIDDDSLTL